MTLIIIARLANSKLRENKIEWGRGISVILYIAWHPYRLKAKNEDNLM